MNDSENIKVKRNLTALVEFSRIINSSLDLEFILNNVLLTCMGKFLATKGLIALNIEGTLVPKSFKGLSNEYLAAFPELEPNENLLKDDKLRNYLDEGKLVAVQRISSSDSCLGIVCLGEKLNRTPFTEDDLEFLGTILNISASAIQNSLMINELKKVNRELDSRIQRLNSLFELSKEFGLLADSVKVAKLLVYSVIGQFLVSKFAVISFEDGGTRILESKFSDDDIITAIKSYDFFSLENSVTKNEIENNYPLMSEMHVELIVPMNIQNKTKGLVLLGKRINNQPYSPADVEFIYSVGSLAIISLENRRLFKEELAKQKMEEELDIARGIQKNLLPSKIPSYEKFDLAVMN